MKHLRRVFAHAAAVLAAVTLVAAVAVTAADKDNDTPSRPPVTTKESPPKKVVKSDGEWKKILTPEQFYVTREAGTERAWGDAYKEFKKQGEGTYFCVGCGAELFSSNEKFDSRCGWPSFYDPSKAKNIKTKTDRKIGYARTEVLCAACDAHLGHVFVGEGFDTPTDKRYCINAVAMKYVPASDGEDERPTPGPDPQPTNEGSTENE